MTDPTLPRESDPAIPEDWKPGMALASALMAAGYAGDSGEDVDRLLAEIEKRGYVLVAKQAPCRHCGSDWHYTHECEAAIRSRPVEEGDRHTFANIDPEALCPVCSLPAWTHDPATAFLYTRSVAARPVEEGTRTERIAALLALDPEAFDWVTAEAARLAARPVEVDPERLRAARRTVEANWTVPLTPDQFFRWLDANEFARREVLAALSAPEPKKP